MGRQQVLGVRFAFIQTGRASFYGHGSEGKATADGTSFEGDKLTAAHRTLPFGTVVRVTNLANGRMVKVRINDRGPHVRGRIIDLSAAAARALGMGKRGIAYVKLKALQEKRRLEAIAR
jgi:rare lipoprotein A